MSPTAIGGDKRGQELRLAEVGGRRGAPTGLPFVVGKRAGSLMYLP